MTKAIKYSAAVSILLLLVFAMTGKQAGANPVNVIVNQWALGIDNATGCPGDINDGWQHNAEMSLSRCYKNPAPPDGAGQGGAAFKCGPVNGQCDVGALGESWQDFNAQNRGVAASSTYTVTYSHLQVCVGCTFVKAELLGSDNGGTSWVNLGTLLDYDPGDPACDTSTYWPTYCGDSLIVPHYDLYRLYVTGSYNQQLGYKFTGVNLSFEPIGEFTPTPTAVFSATPTPSSTPEPTATPTATPTLTFLPLVLEPGNYELFCNGGGLVVNGRFVTCEE